ncbi:Sensor protein EvgS precursor [Roseovarius sp. THAF8]|uniref:sensor histidine kinase n=1 Tax=Roseovarius sp. THAF8 TaxID=2587846 RepID=UPI00126854AD|nr:histidine kinase N-terminal 7TM domain-containing protein [Roseovarius sp. THAF8]QFT97438.1 Sensor protein EvgS precursor [Roseovarius sp. THAF8]
MTCFERAFSSPVFLVAVAVIALAAFTMIWTLKSQDFNGKRFYALTFIGVMWALLCVGLEAASATYACNMQWATLAWLGHGLVTTSWCYFVFNYVGGADWVRTRRATALLLGVTLGIFAVVATNPWHQLVYTGDTMLPVGSEQIEYVHGPGFFTIIALLYTFVMATFVCLIRGFVRAKRSAWPLLSMLTAITLSPLVVNAAYIGLDFTFFGLDPTAFMFTLGVLAFSWMLVVSKTMDMAAVGKSVLFDTSSEPVVLIDRKRNIVLTNAAARKRGLGNGNTQMLRDLFAGHDDLATAADGSHLQIGRRAYEPRIQKVRNPLNPSAEILGWSVTLVDVTDRMAINTSLQEALRAADAANRAKDEFVSVVSHEMRTPLTSLKGGLALALSGHIGEMSDQMRALLEISHRNGIRLSRLIDQILLAQKMDIGALQLDEDAVDLDRLLADSIEENRIFATERKITLVKKSTVSHALVQGDAFAIRQIIDNLLSNAIKFSPENGTVEGAVHMTNGKLRLSIKDTGHGIPEGMEDRVFGRFGQVANQSQHSTQGSGLGLHISKRLACQMHGDLTYDSTLGVGTNFHLEFAAMAQNEDRLAG